MFTIVSMMREELSVMRRFVDYHLKQDVRKILIFFDGPEGEKFKDFFAQNYDADRVSYTVLLPSDYPESTEQTPEEVGDSSVISFGTKQEYVHGLAQGLSPTEWVLSLDADEFLMKSKDLAVQIALIPEDITSFRISVAEAVWGPDDVFGSEFGCTYFRTPFRTPYRNRTKRRKTRRFANILGRLAYGKDRWLFHKNVAGYAAGRVLFRRSAKFDWIGPHRAVMGGETVTKWSRTVFRKKATMWVAHFDAIGFERWVEKLRRRYTKEIYSLRESEQRKYQFKEFARAHKEFLKTGDDAALRALMHRFYGFSAFQYRLLHLYNCAFREQVFSSTSD